MCQSKAEGGKRCAAHSPKGQPRPGSSVKPMPDGFAPEMSFVMRRLLGRTAWTDAERRMIWHRDVMGYQGWLDQDGNPCSEGGQPTKTYRKWKPWR